MLIITCDGVRKEWVGLDYTEKWTEMKNFNVKSETDGQKRVN